MGNDWFAARISSAAMALAHLKQQQFEVFYPTRPNRRVIRNKVVTTERAVFPRYIFVALNLADMRWHAARYAWGINYILPRHSLRPQPLPRGFVDAVRASLAEPEQNIAEVIRVFERDAVVRVLLGPLCGTMCRVLTSRRSTTHIEMLDTEFGRRGNVRATVRTDWLDRA